MGRQFLTAKAVACANIALIKYWGKRDPALNLPAVGSISITLDALKTETEISFSDTYHEDILFINGSIVTEKQRKRVENFLDLLRRRSAYSMQAKINSTNNFPTGAGLASSASAFAALTIAAAHALDLGLSDAEITELARQGSGSAPRSVYGGFVEMQKGYDHSGKKDIAVQIAGEDYWDLRILILITSTKEKNISSTDAMNSSMNTSPYFNEWVRTSEYDLTEMREAIKNKDFEKLGDLSEYNALKMHALTLSSRPAVIYWNQTTIELMHLVRDLRKKGVPVYFTIDAGPQIKVITLPIEMVGLKETFRGVSGVKRIIETKLGEGARLIKDKG